MSLETALDLFWKMTGLTSNQAKLFLRTLWVLVVSTHILWVCGLLIWANIYPPFATAGETKDMQNEVSDIKIQLLEEALFDARLRQCKAETNDAKQYYYQRLQEKMNAYYNVTGRNYRVPACSEIQ